MKLALVRQRYTAFGGAERFVDRALDALRTGGVETTLITRRWSGNWNGPVIRVAPFHVGRCWRDASFVRGVRRTLRRHAFDLVQSHERIPGCDIYRAGDGVHAAWLEQRARFGGATARIGARWSPYHRYLLRTEAAMFRHPGLRAVICNSRMVATDIARRFAVPVDRLHVIYNAVDGERFHPCLVAEYRQPVRRQLDCRDSTRVWLMVGSGFERKGVAEAIQALVGLGHETDDELWIVGHDRRPAHYRRLALRLGVGARVRLLGPQPDVRPYLAAADAFLAPAWYDPFPNASLEALACGLPVIASDATGTAERIVPGRNGSVCRAGDSADLRRHMQALRPLLEDPGLRAAARESVLDLRAETMLEQLSALYRQLLSVR